MSLKSVNDAVKRLLPILRGKNIIDGYNYAKISFSEKISVSMANPSMYATIVVDVENPGVVGSFVVDAGLLRSLSAFNWDGAEISVADGILDLQIKNPESAFKIKHASDINYPDIDQTDIGVKFSCIVNTNEFVNEFSAVARHAVFAPFDYIHVGSGDGVLDLVANTKINIGYSSVKMEDFNGAPYSTMIPQEAAKFISMMPVGGKLKIDIGVSGMIITGDDFVVRICSMAVKGIGEFPYKKFIKILDVYDGETSIMISPRALRDAVAKVKSISGNDLTSIVFKDKKLVVGSSDGSVLFNLGEFSIEDSVYSVDGSRFLAIFPDIPENIKVMFRAKAGERALEWITVVNGQSTHQLVLLSRP